MQLQSNAYDTLLAVLEFAAEHYHQNQCVSKGASYCESTCEEIHKVLLKTRLSDIIKETETISYEQRMDTILGSRELEV